MERLSNQPSIKCALRNWWDSAGIKQLSRELYPTGEGSHATASEVALTWYKYPETMDRTQLEPRIAPNGSFADAEDCYLQVTLTDSRRPQHAMERLRSRFEHALILAFEPEGGRAARGPIMPRVDGRSDLDIALGFVAEARELLGVPKRERSAT